MTGFVAQVTETAGWNGHAAPALRAFTPPGQTQDRAELDGSTQTRSGRAALLKSFVETEILPRLAMPRLAASRLAAPHAAAHRWTAPDPAGRPAETSGDDVARLVALALSDDTDGMLAFMDVRRLQGASLESLYLGLLSDAAHRLGDLWNADRVDFGHVTVAMGRLQQVVRVMSQTFQAAAARRADRHSVLLLPAPGEQHTFGLVMLGEFFQRSGWHVAGGPVAQGLDAAETVRGAWFDIAAFSIGSEARLDGLAKCIRRVRRASRNRGLAVMVGGPLFLQRPDLVARVGADTAAADAPGAVRSARDLLAARAVAAE